MIVDLIRWVRDVEANVDTGLNSQLSNVPRDDGEMAPDQVSIFNDVDHDWVSRGINRAELVDADGNARTVFIIRTHPDPQGFRVQLLPEYEKTDPNIVPVLLMAARRRIEKDGLTVTVASQVRDLKQTIRTAVRVLAQQFDSTITAHSRNGCTITLPSTGFILNANDLVERTDDLVVEVAIGSFRVQDTWAMGL